MGFGLENTISIADFVVISVIGGFLSSIVVLAITVVVAQLGVRRNWDLDNVVAPIVTAAGDMVTLPALFLATYLVGLAWVTPIVAVLCAVVGIGALVAQRALAATRSCAASPASRCRCSSLAGTIDVIAGLTIEKRFESFLVYPALLVLVPPFLEDSGALGGILERARVDQAAPRHARARSRGGCARSARTCCSIYLYAIPVFFLLGVSADIAVARRRAARARAASR